MQHEKNQKEKNEVTTTKSLFGDKINQNEEVLCDKNVGKSFYNSRNLQKSPSYNKDNKRRSWINYLNEKEVTEW